MPFWKKSEDPWDMDPNRRKRTVYEREPDPESEPEMGGGLAAPREITEQEPQEDAPDCPWCGEKMIRAYLLGGRDMICFADQKPHGFWGSLGHEKTYLGDDTGFFGGNYQSCWQCKPCYKLVIDIPQPTAPNYVWEDGEVKLPEEGGTCWDGNPVRPPSPDEIEKEE